MGWNQVKSFQFFFHLVKNFVAEAMDEEASVQPDFPLYALHLTSLLLGQRPLLLQLEIVADGRVEVFLAFKRDWQISILQVFVQQLKRGK